MISDVCRAINLRSARRRTRRKAFCVFGVHAPPAGCLFACLRSRLRRVCRACVDDGLGTSMNFFTATRVIISESKRGVS